MQQSRVAMDHRIMGGVPCVRGTRIPVPSIVGLIAQGYSINDVVADFPQLAREDVMAALEFAAEAVNERHIPLDVPA